MVVLVAIAAAAQGQRSEQRTRPAQRGERARRQGRLERGTERTKSRVGLSCGCPAAGARGSIRVGAAERRCGSAGEMPEGESDPDGESDGELRRTRSLVMVRWGWSAGELLRASGPGCTGRSR